jgi:glycosyltransferase involved in cell wall biosynthesis
MSLCERASRFMADPSQPKCLLHAFSTFAVGGPQVRFCDVANALGRDYRHVIIAMDNDFACASRLEEHVTWDAVRVSAVKSRGISFGNLKRFRKILATVRPDVLITYNFGALEWALANRWWPLAPHLHFEDGFGPDETATQLARRVYLRRLVLDRKARVVVPSHTLWTIATNLWGLSPRQVLLIPNGVDCDRFGAMQHRGALEGFGIDRDSVVIGTVTALRPEKNLKRLISAFARLAANSSPQLVIVGEGTEREKLERFAKDSSVARVHFTGSVLRPEELYGCFDIFAISSDTEQMPISLVEAMASGLPVVATDVGDIAKIVAPENRFLIEGCTDEEGLARGMLNLALDPELRQRLGTCNRLRARAEFGINKMVRSYKRLFDGTALTEVIPSTGLPHEASFHG